jgi:hypothetical protein
MPNKECQFDKILNPITNRCVNRNGKIGKAILANKKTKKECDPNKKKSDYLYNNDKNFFLPFFFDFVFTCQPN